MVRKKDRVDLDHQKEHDKAAEIAEYYGITPIETPAINPEVEKKIKALKEVPSPCKFPSKSEEVLATSHSTEKATLINSFTAEWAHLPKPLSVFYELPFKGSGSKKIPKTACYGIDIIGSSQSVADAILIQTSKAILEDAGYKKLTFEVNCIGERDATARFEKELTSYFRKNISSLSPEEQKIFKADVFHLLTCPKKSKTLEELVSEAPQAMNFLSEAGRVHFKQLLEHLEELGIDYQINGHLLENKNYSSHTNFAIKDDKGKMLAIGSRYNGLGRKIGFRRDLPAVGIRICFKELKARKKTKAHQFPQKCFYFMQLGAEAKLKSLKVIEELRKKKIPVCHSLTRDKASGQLSSADNLKMPYILIMGKKEAHEGTVAVRESTTRSQKIVPVGNLTKELTKIQKAIGRKKKK